MGDPLRTFLQFISDRGIDAPQPSSSSSSSSSPSSLSAAIAAVYDQLDESAMRDMVDRAIEARDSVAAAGALPDTSTSASASSSSLSASMGAWGAIIDAMREETGKRQSRGG